MWVWRACVGAVLLLSLWASAALQRAEQDDALASTGVVSQPELTDLRRFSRASDQFQGNEVAYQSSRVALTGHSPASRRRFHRPFVRRRVFIVDGDAGGRAARRSVDGAQSAADRSTRVRVGSYFNSNLTHRLSDERAFFSWNGRRGSGGRGGWRRRRPAIAASALRTNGTTYDRRGPVRIPRPGGATGGVVVTRLPGRTVYRNASGTYVRRVGATIRHPVRVEPQRSLPPLTTHQRHVTMLNHTVITNRTVVASSLAREDPTNRSSSSSSSAAISVSSLSSNTSPAHESAVFHNAGFSAPTGRHESSSSSGSSGSFSFQSLSQSADSSTLRAHQMFNAHSSTSPPSIAASSPSASVTTAGNGEALGRQRAAGFHSVDGSGDTNVHIAAELRRAYIQRNRLQTIGECACNMLGTDATAAGACDATTGQCRCLPNVMGRQCDRCVPAHWKIAIGSGCEPCDCDPAGSTDEQCNEYDGQCRCRAGFGGRRCDQCEPRHWGDPRRGQCRQCQCNSQGSAAAQCDRESGRCQCRSGIGGDRCDRCARGHRGQAPDCQPCGECFDNWDRVLQQLQESTNVVVDEAEALERYGATGVYGAEFAQLNDWLDDVRHVLGNASLTDQQLDQLQLAIERVRLNLSESESQLQSVETLADNTTHRLLLLDVRVPALRTRAQQLHAAAAALRDNATRLQEADVDGALALTREAQRRSKAAEISVMDTQRSLAEAGRQRRRTDNLLARATQRFNESRVPVQQLLRDATARLHAVEQQLPDINSQVCDGGGAPCDALCGGGGCDRCGGLSCDDGAATRAANALSVATDTVSVLAEREREVDELLRRVTAAKLAADEAYSVARAAFSDAQRLSNSSQQVEQRLQQLLEQIDELLQLPAATPQDIQRLAQQVLSKSISLRPEQISRLASEINETMSSLTDVNSILAETANDLNLANSLKQRADKAKQAAETILNTAEAVTTALQQAGVAQSIAGQQITDADAAVQLAQQQLASIATASLSAERDANASVVAMQQLKARHKIVIKEFARNEINVARAVKEAGLADEMAGKAHQKAEQLDLNYRQAMATLNNETAAGSSSRLAVKQLLAQTSSLLAETVGQLNELEEINLEFSRHEDVLSDMSDEIDSLHTRLDSYLHVITTRAEHYRTCQS